MTAEEALKSIIEDGIELGGGDYVPLETLKVAKEALEKQIPKKPYTANENGEYEKDYCPTCHRSLFPYDHHCRCGQAIDWSGVQDDV